MMSFIEDYREDFGVVLICRELPIASSSYCARKAVINNPGLASNRVKNDQKNIENIKDVWHNNREVYGSCKIWYALKQQGHDILRCTVERLMKRMGIKGVYLCPLKLCHNFS